jgi:folate-dependent phosphoribosylglycinamide formyltransferase PurN
MSLNKKILILASEDISTNIVFNALNRKFGVDSVIIEEKEPMTVFLKRRIKSLGILKVIGQVLFKITVVKYLSRVSKNRIDEILVNKSLDANDIGADKLKYVKSVNSEETIALIKSINPDLVILNGTRIVSRKVLGSVSCRFINTHAGITPKYRGVHGAYWALVNNDAENSGVTVHYVDAGVDTGDIISQQNVIPTAKDNFVTYPFLQLSAGIDLLLKAVNDHFSQQIVSQHISGKSAQYYHPTLLQYLYYLIIKKVK